MKIYTNNYYNAGYQNNKRTVTRNNQPTFGFIALATEASKNTVPKMGYLVDKLNIKGRTKEQLVDLAEYLHKLSNDTLKNDVALRYTKYIGRRVKDNEAYELIHAAVKNVKSKKLAAVQRINILEPKKALGYENSIEQKMNLTNTYIAFTELEKMKLNPPITQGILLYGKGDKASMEKWLIETADLNSKITKYTTPEETIKLIAKEADVADENFKKDNKRTLLVIENLDEMLSKHNDLDDIIALGRFKNVMEALENRKLTVVTSINKPIETIEPASIADHRFGIQLEIKPGITKEEDRELTELKNYINRLEQKANEHKSKFIGRIS